MGKSSIKYSYPIESVSRKMTLRKNTASKTTRVTNGEGQVASVEKDVYRFMGGGVRTYNRCGLGNVEQNYLFVRFHARGTAVSADEIAHRTTFSNAAKLSKNWINSLATAAKVIEEFNAKVTRAGVSPLGYTLSGWRFAVAYAVIGLGGTPSSDWPQA